MGKICVSHLRFCTGGTLNREVTGFSDLGNPRAESDAHPRPLLMALLSSCAVSYLWSLIRRTLRRLSPLPALHVGVAVWEPPLGEEQKR